MFLKSSAAQWPVVSVADLHSKILDASLPPRPNYFNFMQFGKFWQNCMLAPPGGGSATEYPEVFTRDLPVADLK